MDYIINLLYVKEYYILQDFGNYMI